MLTMILTRAQVAAMFGVPVARATTVWEVCLYDADGGEEDYVWRTAVFSTKQRATARAKDSGCAYRIHEMVVDEPMWGWEAVN